MKLPKLYHYSGSPIRKVEQYEHYLSKIPPRIVGNRFKPIGKTWGFWVSVGNDWERWSRQESFCLDDLKYKYQIVIRKNHNLLMLDNLEKFDAFSEQYGYDSLPCIPETDYMIEFFKKLPEAQQKRLLAPRKSDIHWDELKKLYQGLIIYPYFWNRRTMCRSSEWYYGWDCASGCIWDVSCIKGIKRVLPKKALDRSRSSQ